MYWDQLTSAQIAVIDRAIPVILPMAATEQHGPHLPVATDRMIAEHFCKTLDERISDGVLILPAMAVGCSEHHLDFAGSLSLRHQTFLNQAEDLAESVIHHGFRKVVFLNSHGGNQGVGVVLIETMGYRNPDVQFALASWWTLAADGLAELNETGPGGVGHAGEFETSLMLEIAPDLVHLDKIEPPANTDTFDWATADLLRGSRAALYRRMGEMTTNGAFGDPRAASAEKGRAITEVVVARLEQVVMDLRSS